MRARLLEIGKKRQEAPHLLAAIVEASDDAIIATTLGGIVLSWNPAAERIFGYTAGEMAGQPLSTLVSPDRQDEIPAILEKVSRGERIRYLERYGLRKDRIGFPVEISLSRLETEEGVLVSAVIRDVTERKQAEESLRMSEERLRLVLDTVQEAFVAIDADGVITAWNPEAESTFGWSRDEAVGGRLSEMIIPPEYREAHKKGLRR